MIERRDRGRPRPPAALRGPTGLLAQFNEAGCSSAADVHVARRLGAMARGGPTSRCCSPLALAVRAVRHGSVCVDLATVADVARGRRRSCPGPTPDGWLARGRGAARWSRPAVLRVEHACSTSTATGARRARSRDDLLAPRSPGPRRPWSTAAACEAGVAAGLPGRGYDEQRAAARAAAAPVDHRAHRRPGHRQDHHGRRPAGAARRAGRAGRGPAAADRADRARPARRRPGCRRPSTTPTAALGPRADRDRLGRPARPRPCTGCSAGGPTAAPASGTTAATGCPHDVVVVDETSMVSLTMMARLLEAVRPDARLVLVGDPDQLASVEAGAVLADLVDGLGGRAPGAVAALRTSHRFGGEIGELAEALRDGDADRVIEAAARGRRPRSSWSTPTTTPALAGVRGAVARRTRSPYAAAALGGRRRRRASTALDRHRLLCAHREGPYGVAHWNRQVERWLADAHRRHRRYGPSGTPAARCWSPPTTTASASTTATPAWSCARRRRRAARSSSPASDGACDFATTRLGDVETMHAMTSTRARAARPTRSRVLLPAGGLAAADPRALLHRGHPGPGSGPRGRHARRPSGPPSASRAQRATGLRPPPGGT